MAPSASPKRSKLSISYSNLWIPAVVFALFVCALNIVFLLQYGARESPRHHGSKPRHTHSRPPPSSLPQPPRPGSRGTKPEKQRAPWIPSVEDDPRDVELSIWTKNGTRNETAPFLGGLLFEDISQSGDGGVYAELIRNRAFQGSGVTFGQLPNIPFRSIISSQNPTIPFGPVLDGWSGIGKVCLQIDIPSDATGEVGFQNEGFWGINVSPQTYNASFYVQSSGVRFNWGLTQFDVSLRSALTGEVWSKNTIDINGRLGPFKHTYYNTTLENTAQAPNINNTFAITFDAQEARGQTLYFNLISLFPETYKNRPNGLRKDLAEHLADMKPRFLRFPGGNNLEGYSIQRRWKWWKTIGPLKDRPGRPGDWTYYNTDGLGLLEYLLWCEDMEMEPLLAVYDGFSLDVSNYDHGNSTDANEYPLSAMQEVLDEALDELEYCMGSVETYWGQKRAQHGHPEPFDIKMVQIGNEGFFSHRYPERSDFMYAGLKARYPDIQYIFSALGESSEFTYKVPENGIWDAHIYAGAAQFIDQFPIYDNFNPLNTTSPLLVALMEYHVSAVASNTNRHPSLAAAVTEAVYGIAGERNPNTVRLWCFAPLMQNLNAYRGTPYDLLFTADPKDTVRSASYYQQSMFNRWHGTHTLTVTETEGLGGINPLFWVASVEEPKGEMYLKVVNAGASRVGLRVRVDAEVKGVNGTVLMGDVEGDLNAFNWVDEHVVLPREIAGLVVGEWRMGEEGEEDEKDGASVEWTVPPFSVAVLQLDLA